MKSFMLETDITNPVSLNVITAHNCHIFSLGGGCLCVECQVTVPVSLFPIIPFSMSTLLTFLDSYIFSNYLSKLLGRNLDRSIYTITTHSFILLKYDIFWNFSFLIVIMPNFIENYVTSFSLQALSNIS